MGAREIVGLVDELVFNQTGKHLSKTQRIVLCEFWENQKRTYQEIADAHKYSEAHLKGAGSKLWQVLSKALDLLGNKG